MVVQSLIDTREKTEIQRRSVWHVSNIFIPLLRNQDLPPRHSRPLLRRLRNLTVCLGGAQQLLCHEVVCSKSYWVGEFEANGGDKQKPMAGKTLEGWSAICVLGETSPFSGHCDCTPLGRIGQMINVHTTPDVSARSPTYCWAL